VVFLENSTEEFVKAELPAIGKVSSEYSMRSSSPAWPEAPGNPHGPASWVDVGVVDLGHGR